jgi:DNA-binding transcriptional regulator YdaS (Cro superfamily)
MKGRLTANKAGLYTAEMDAQDLGALEKAFSEAGGQSAIAAACGVTTQAVGQWKKVPPDRVIHVARATSYRVTPHQLRPDLYPHPDDGLPEERRRRSCS